jgi:predicted amidohydrolase
MCQIIVLDGDRRGNFTRIENAIVEAKSKGANMLCFPEAMLLGWLNPDAHNRSHPIPGPDSDRLCELAKRYDVYLCVGLEEKDADRLYNSAILIDEKGQILLKHRQINVASELMNPPYSPGSDIGIADTKFGRIGLLICSDTHREDILDRMAALKPNLLLTPLGFAEEGAKWPGHGQELQQVVANTAKRTGAVVVGTNPVGRISKGPWTGRVYGGQSVAADKTGKIIAVAKDRDRDITIVSISATK